MIDISIKIEMRLIPFKRNIPIHLFLNEKKICLNYLSLFIIRSDTRTRRNEISPERHNAKFFLLPFLMINRFFCNIKSIFFLVFKVRVDYLIVIKYFKIYEKKYRTCLIGKLCYYWTSHELKIINFISRKINIDILVAFFDRIFLFKFFEEIIRSEITVKWGFWKQFLVWRTILCNFSFNSFAEL